MSPRSWRPVNPSTPARGFPASIPYLPAHLPAAYSFDPGTPLAAARPGIYADFLPNGQQTYHGGGAAYVLDQVAP